MAGKVSTSSPQGYGCAGRVCRHAAAAAGEWPGRTRGCRTLWQPLLIITAKEMQRGRSLRSILKEANLSTSGSSRGLTRSERCMGLLGCACGLSSRGARRCALVSGSTRSSLLARLRWRLPPCANSALAWWIVCSKTSPLTLPSSHMLA